MPKTYKNPPLIEAVCEFRFELSKNFSEKEIFNFYENIKISFPIARKGKMHSLQVKLGVSGAPNENNNKYKEGFYEFEQYLSEDEKYSVQLDGGRVSIHRVKPYTSWTDFFPLVKEVYNSYINNFYPKKLIRIGIRYVNEVILPTDGFLFGDYFTIKASLPSLEKNNQKSIFLGSVFEQEDGRDAIKVQFVEKQSVKSTANRTFVLDFDYFLVKPLISFDIIDEWLNKAHTNLENVFEGMVTSKARQLFDK